MLKMNWKELNFCPKIFVLVICLTLFTPSVQWKTEGHAIIAAIAESKLKEDPDQTILQKILDMLKPLRVFFPEREDSIIEAAVVPLELKRGFFGFLDNYRSTFKPIIYWKDSSQDIEFPNWMGQYNMTYAMNQTQLIINQAINSPQGDHQIIKNGLMDSLMLRYLLHITGNLHHPLDNASMFSNVILNGKIKKGDRGGRQIPVNDIFNKDITNLHSLYDISFNVFDYQELRLPLSDDNITLLKNQAKYLVKKYPESYFKSNVDNLNYVDWSDESYNIASDFVYSQIEFLPLLNPEYIITARKICEERLTLAGYRLYKLLKAFFQKSKKKEPSNTEGK